MKPGRATRREFLKSSVCLAAPLILPASVFGQSSRPAPSNRIALGFIGVGHMGSGLLKSFLQHEDAQVVAVCDVDTKRREAARAKVDEFYAAWAAKGSYRGCRAFNDFRELIALDELDALVIALPDHWHAIPVIQGAKAGKDIYAEKPLALTVEQGIVMRDTVHACGRVFQTGSQLRSMAHVRKMCELVRNGRIGEIREVRVVSGEGPTIEPPPAEAVPKGFDYDRWLGPAPWAPYTEKRCHFNFRYNLDYSGGKITDYGAHYCDMAQWGLGTELTGPVEIEGRGEFPKNSLWNAAVHYRVECTYANGIKLVVADQGKGGCEFIGSEGRVHSGDAYMDADPPSLVESRIGPDEIHLYESRDHHQNFLDCVKSRRPTVAPIEQAHRSITIPHLGNIAMQLNRKLRWDPERERFIDDPEADRMLSRAMRLPWSLRV